MSLSVALAGLRAAAARMAAEEAASRPRASSLGARYAPAPFRGVVLDVGGERYAVRWPERGCEGAIDEDGALDALGEHAYAAEGLATVYHARDPAAAARVCEAIVRATRGAISARRACDLPREVAASPTRRARFVDFV